MEWAIKEEAYERLGSALTQNVFRFFFAKGEA